MLWFRFFNVRSIFDIGYDFRKRLSVLKWVLATSVQGPYAHRKLFLFDLTNRLFHCFGNRSGVLVMVKGIQFGLA